jgi:hypothetical protein
MRLSACGHSHIARVTTIAILGTCVVFASGCGKPSAPGKVSGHVLLDGKPLTGGKVTFRAVGPNTFPITVTLDESGKYPDVELPAGEVTVSVDNRALKPAPTGKRPSLAVPKGANADFAKAIEAKNAAASAPPKAPEIPGKYMEIPSRYYEAPDDLKFTVEPGKEQKHDIELKSR